MRNEPIEYEWARFVLLNGGFMTRESIFEELYSNPVIMAIKNNKDLRNTVRNYQSGTQRYKVGKCCLKWCRETPSLQGCHRPSICRRGNICEASQMKYAWSLSEIQFEGEMGGERKGKWSITLGEKFYWQTSQ